MTVVYPMTSAPNIHQSNYLGITKKYKICLIEAYE